jgi:hypothetical protein
MRGEGEGHGKTVGRGEADDRVGIWNTQHVKSSKNLIR